MKRVLGVLLLLLPLACELDGDKLTTNCHVADDQRGSFMVRVPGAPVRILADQAFTAPERSELQGAIAEWNRYAKSLMGREIFSVSFVGVPDAQYGGDPCAMRDPSADSFYIVRQTDAQKWETLGFSSAIPGATRRCQTPHALSNQVMYINPALINPLQQQSVFLHELGHSLGLDHSCATPPGSADYKSCGAITEDHPYHVAVMYPALRVAASSPTPNTSTSSSQYPEIKEALRTNDMERAACLYPSP